MSQVDARRLPFGVTFLVVCVFLSPGSGADVAGVISIHGIFPPGDIPNKEIKLRSFVYMVTKIQWCLLIKF
ncbi:MAG: hypothetical protein Ct9H90mP25_6230 [Gammaproteobacteria bacterium]|nr:MAG: hypothetical protein Ct9H90mP25_6230 [Gammaproteobacteria bacterium]